MSLIQPIKHLTNQVKVRMQFHEQSSPPSNRPVIAGCRGTRKSLSVLLELIRRRNARKVKLPKKIQYDENDSDNEQSMDPTARFRKSWTDVFAKIAEEPQYNENNDDSPQHEISPYE